MATRRRHPAMTPEAQENHMIHLAMEVAEEQMRNRTASPQVIVHYLKLGTERERIEKEILEKQKELITAKTDALQSAKVAEELYAKAIKAIRDYSGADEEEEVDDDE